MKPSMRAPSPFPDPDQNQRCHYQRCGMGKISNLQLAIRPRVPPSCRTTPAVRISVLGKPVTWITTTPAHPPKMLRDRGKLHVPYRNQPTGRGCNHKGVASSSRRSRQRVIGRSLAASNRPPAAVRGWWPELGNEHGIDRTATRDMWAQKRAENSICRMPQLCITVA